MTNSVIETMAFKILQDKNEQLQTDIDKCKVELEKIKSSQTQLEKKKNNVQILREQQQKLEQDIAQQLEKEKQLVDKVNNLFPLRAELQIKQKEQENQDLIEFDFSIQSKETKRVIKQQNNDCTIYIEQTAGQKNTKFYILNETQLQEKVNNIVQQVQ